MRLSFNILYLVSVWVMSLVVIASIHKVHGQDDISVVVTMICRDEEVNFKSNLELWTRFVKYFVFMLDDRTSDNSMGTITSILKGKAEFAVILYQFEGFGQARTRSLSEAHRIYPQASHVIIADPDWRPDMSTFSYSMLSPDVQVYRFTAYDRNGITNRQMDWILRNEPGLRMRYHLHEVLDIGDYNWTTIPFVVHEIEQPGTWHTKMGHGNSFGMKRYFFDLELLYKDLEEYGHDSHTHYYLGLTSCSVLEKINLDSPPKGLDVERYKNDCLKYLTLRVESTYSAEFVEERWGAMYYLAINYQLILGDFVKSEYWLRMCRDFDDANFECGLALARLYLGHNQLPMAIGELERMLRLPRQKRAMLNFIYPYDCDLPKLAIEIYGYYLLAIQKSADPATLQSYVKYCLLLYKMASNANCGDRNTVIKLPGNMEDFLDELLPLNGLDMTSSYQQLCSDIQFVTFLYHGGFKVHVCEDVTKQAIFDDICSFLTHEKVQLIPDENSHATSGFHEFISGVSFAEIIHYVYGGDKARIEGLNRPLRILYAEYFHMKGLLTLMAYGAASLQNNFQIVVLSKDPELAANVKSALRVCGKYSYVKLVSFHNLSIQEYFDKQRLLDASSNDRTVRSEFDVIEYNGGLSLSPSPRNDLSLLLSLLKPDGVLCVTYFSSNIHQANIHRIIESRNVTALVPLSQETERIVKHYLAASNLPADILSKDSELMRFLAHDIHGRVQQSARLTADTTKFEGVDLGRGIAYHVHQVEDLIHGSGGSVHAVFPTAFSRPYSEIEELSTQQFRSLGFSEQEVVFNFYPTFRKTMYVTRSDACVHGRIVPDDDVYRAFGKDIIVVDRFGSLSQAFAHAPQLSFQNQASVCHARVFATVNSSNLQFLAMPTISPCLALLSNSPTLESLHENNIAFHKDISFRFNEPVAKKELMKFLSKLASINAVTLKFRGKREPPVCNPATGSDNRIGTSPPTFKEPTPAVNAPDQAFPDTRYQPSFPPNTISAASNDNATEKARKALQRLFKSGFTEKIMIDAMRSIDPKYSEDDVKKMIADIRAENSNPNEGLQFPIKPDQLKKKTSDSESAPMASPLKEAENLSLLHSLTEEQLQKVEKLRKLGYSDSTIVEALHADKENQKLVSRVTIGPTANVVSEHISSDSTSSLIGESTTIDSSVRSRGDNALPQDDTTAARMRAMGFPEHIIAAKLKADSSRRPNGGGQVNSRQKDDHQVGSSDTKASSTKSSSLIGESTTIDSSARSRGDNALPQDDTTAARMRAMGFPEHIVAAKLKADSSRRPNGGGQVNSRQKDDHQVVSSDTKASSTKLTEKPAASAAVSASDQEAKLARLRAMGIPEKILSTTFQATPIQEPQESVEIGGLLDKKSEPRSLMQDQTLSSDILSDGLTSEQNAKIAKMRRMGFPEEIIMKAVASDKISKGADMKIPSDKQNIEKVTTVGLPSNDLSGSIDAQTPPLNPTISQNSLSDPVSISPKLPSTSNNRIDSTQSSIPNSRNEEVKSIESILEAKADKMRRMGFPSKVVDQAIAEERKRLMKSLVEAPTSQGGAPTDSLQASLPPSSQQSQLDAKSSAPSAFDLQSRNNRVASTAADLATASKSYSAEDLSKHLAAKEARMRAMGFPEDLIKQALETERINQLKKSATKDSARSESKEPASFSTESVVSQSAKKSSWKFVDPAELNLLDQNERNQIVHADANQGPILGTDVSSASVVSKLLQDRLNEVTKKLPVGSQSSIPSSIAEDKVTEIDDGVKRAVSASSSSTLASSASETSTTEKVRALTYVAENKVSVPDFQLINMLHISKRSADCMGIIIGNGQAVLSHCDPANDPASIESSKPANNRRTSTLFSVSAYKIAFDLNQFQFISAGSTSVTLLKSINAIIPFYKTIREYLDSHMTKGRKVGAFRLPLDTYNSINGVLNRIVHLEPESRAPVNSVIHDGALLKLQEVVGQLDENDFVVVDGVLKQAALLTMTSYLMKSTIWFDVTNGAALAAHFDDSPIDNTIVTLARLLAASLATAGRPPLRVVRVYSMAMNISATRSGPVASANQGEIAVVLWLNPKTAPSITSIANNDEDADSPRSNNDGLRVFDKTAINTLKAQGIGIYPSIHDVFLSSVGSLAVDMPQRCSSCDFDTVPRSSNRLIILSESRPFMLMTNETSGLAHLQRTKRTDLRSLSFEETTEVALVMVFASDNSENS